MVNRSIKELEEELLKAAMKGINEFLSTTRGAHLFGASAKAEMPDDETISVWTQHGETTISTDTGMFGYSRKVQVPE